MPKGVYPRTKPVWNKGLTKSDPRVVKYVHPEIPPLMRFFNKVNITEGCWYWKDHCTEEGYGQFWLNGRMVYAHIFLYELLHGPVPDGMELDHLCRNPGCVNPAHLEPVCHQENCRRGLGGKYQRREPINAG